MPGITGEHAQENTYAETLHALALPLVTQQVH